jgi:hypothetical protein
VVALSLDLGVQPGGVGAALVPAFMQVRSEVSRWGAGEFHGDVGNATAGRVDHVGPTRPG